ncbi:putative phosphoesterase [Dyadobacter jejuensis]|uniref:Putative phosphoesterase n=1 Tax=Dyadobacter jejuensis TaxID=1082580 RepID=A0A316ADH8_9BACT|nr:metallophosphoesterase family protein [Dyadobacter jejuensis]PWJ55020.1 putative phosphoesterase [Dyadobacter jejuensis]
MRIALLSDIHANLPALEAVLDDLEKQQPDAVYCLGDLIGYQVWPNQVVELVRKRGIPTIAGNHDIKLTTLRPKLDPCSQEPSKEYAYQLVGPKERDYLLTLPRQIRLEFQINNTPLTLLMVHGSPRSINEYLLEDLPEAYMIEMAQEFKADILCFGHTHKPYHRVVHTTDGELNPTYHFINTGSVGKPKDGDPRAGYVMLTIDGQERATISTEFIRLPYDVEKAAKAIELSLLPNELAGMLREGK